MARLGLVGQVGVGRRQARDYAMLIAWFLHDLLAHYRWRSLRLIATGGGRLGVRYAAMGVLYVFIRQFEEKTPLSLFGFELPGPETPGFVVLGLGLGVLLLMAAASLRYELRNRAIVIGSEYEEICLRRLFMLAGRLPHPRAPEASRVAAAGHLAHYIGYARQCGVLARQLGLSLPAVASVVIAAVLLIAIDPGLTGTIALIALVGLALQYPANRRAAKASVAFEDHNPRANLQIRDLFRELRSAPLPLSVDSPVLDRLFGGGSVRKARKGFSTRVLAVEQAGLASELGGTLILGGCLLTLIFGILEGELTFAHVALYIGVMRYLLKDFVRLSRAFAMINRFHEQINRYVAFVRSAEKAHERPAAHSPRRPEVVTFAVPELEGGNNSLEVGPRSVLALLAPQRPNVSLPGMLVAALGSLKQCDCLPPTQVGGKLIEPAVPLRDSLALPKTVDGQRLVEDLADFAPQRQTVEWAGPGWLDHEPKRPWDQVLPGWAILALQALAARERGHGIIMIEARSLEAMGEEWWRAFKSQLSERIVFLVYHEVEGVGERGETAAILCDCESARNWVSLQTEEDLRPRLEAAFAELAGQAARQSVAIEDEPLELE
jgi:hypothetical protein